MGPFVKAVTQAAQRNSDNWEFEYYRGQQGDYSKQRQPVFHQGRGVALGPAWVEHIKCKITMDTTQHRSRLQQEKDKLAVQELFQRWSQQAMQP